MLIISFLAAGFVAAALFCSRAGEGLPHRLTPADERGITLQTLIVTAVLVLMAVAAGVVIVAITNSSSDDLEESGTDVQARCNAVEIYDPVVASRNERGSNFGSMGNKFESRRIGCIPVCVWDNVDGNNDLEASELKYRRDASDLNVQARDAGPNTEGRIYLLFSGDRDNVQVYNAAGTDGVAVPNSDLQARVVRVAVAPNQNQCLAYDANGDPVLG